MVVAEASDDSSLPAVPDYTLLRVIGRGAYGDVWLARSTTGMFRAVKVVWRARFDSERPYEREYGGVKRFERVSLSEPSQLALLHVGRNDAGGFFYYVVELADDCVRGRDHVEPETYEALTLRQTLQQAPLPVREVIDLGVLLCRALATLHRHGLVHRDVKPSNVIFVGGVPKLADIGLIAIVEENRTLVGTPPYMRAGGAADASADVFALGKVLYELATGLAPMQWPALPPDLARRADRKQFFELNAVLLRACAPSPRDGFADAGAMLEELLLLQSGKSVLRLRFLEKRVGQVLRAAAILAVIAGVAIAGAWIQYKRAETAEAARDEERQRNNYAAILTQAQRAIDTKDFGRARTLLASAPFLPGEGQRRGIEWRLLRRQADGDPCVIVRDAGHAVERIVLSPDRSIIAIKDASRRVEIRGAGDAGLRHTVEGVHRLAGFSSDGSWLLGTDERYGLRRWSIRNGQVDAGGRWGQTFRPLGVQPPSRIVATVDEEFPTVVVWDFDKNEEQLRRRLVGVGETKQWEFMSGAVNATGTALALVCVRGEGANARLAVCRAELSETGPVVWSEELPAISGIGFDSSNNAWAIERVSGRKWSIEPGSQLWKLEADAWPTDTIGFASVVHLNSELVFAAGPVLACTQETGSPIRLLGHGGSISAFAVAPDEKIWSGTTNGEVRVWRKPLAAASVSLRASTANGLFPTFVSDPEGGSVMVSTAPDEVTVLDARTFTAVAVVRNVRRAIWFDGSAYWAESVSGDCVVAGHISQPGVSVVCARANAQIVNFGISGKRSRAAIGWSDGVVTVIDTTTARIERVIPGRFPNCWPIQLDETGRRLWIAAADRVVRLVDASSGAVSWIRAYPQGLSFILLSDHGRVLAVGRQDGSTDLLNAESGDLIHSVACGSGPADAAFQLDSDNRFGVAGSDGYISIFESRGSFPLAQISVCAPNGIARAQWMEAGKTLLVIEDRSGAVLALRD